jgi:hypothetical protein
VAEYTHTESSDGKTALVDGHFAILSTVFNHYVAEGNDLMVPEDLYAAVVAAKIPGCYPSVVDLSRDKTPPRGTAWPHVSRFSQWLYSPDGSIIVKEQSGIGPGQRRPREFVDSRIVAATTLRSDPSKRYVFEGTGVQFQWQGLTDLDEIRRVQTRPGPETLARKAAKKDIAAEKRAAKKADEEREVREDKYNTGLFYCEMCDGLQRFTTLQYLSDHLASGKHKVAKKTLADFVLGTAAEETAHGGFSVKVPGVRSVAMQFGPVRNRELTQLVEGYGTKPPPRKHPPVSVDMRAFLIGLFNRGVSDDGRANKKQKVTAAAAERLMATERNEDGQPRFKKTEYLVRSRIRQFFSQCASKLRQKVALVTVDKLERAVVAAASGNPRPVALSVQGVLLNADDAAAMEEGEWEDTTVSDP